MAKQSRVDVTLLEAESIGAALDWIADLIDVPRHQRERVLRLPAVAGFLELVTAGSAVSDHRAAGRSRRRAIEAAAAELGCPTDTLRKRIQRSRKKGGGAR